MNTLQKVNIVALQMTQGEHNRRQHPDVNERNVTTQQEHYMHHLHKYVGKMHALHLNSTIEGSAEFKKIWTDTTLITLSLANCMSYTLTENLQVTPCKIAFSELLNAPDQPFIAVNQSNILPYFDTYLTLTSSLMASGFDKLYHGEKTLQTNISHYHVIQKSLDALFHTCQLTADIMGWDVENEIRSKHYEIFSKRIA